MGDNKLQKKKPSPIIDWSRIREALGVFFHWRKPELDISPSDEIYDILIRLRPPLIVMILVLTFGMIGYMAIDNYKAIDALYMTVITIATVGYTEVSETSSTGRIFTILLIFSGIGSFGYSIGVIVSLVSEGALLHLIKERIMLKHIGLLEKHFIICSFNETSHEIVRQFHKKHFPFVVIDDDGDFEKKMRAFRVEHYIVGPPFKDENLLKAHISTCKGIIAASQNDNDNFAIVVSAKILLEKYNNHRAIIISIAHNDENKEKLFNIGASQVITPQILAGQRLVTYALKPETFYFMNEIIYSDKTDVDIEELHIYNTCGLTGKPIKETDLKESGITLLAVKKGKEISVPITGDMVLDKDDTLIIMGKISNIRLYVDKYSSCFSE